ncbi:MAG: hypothetical protein SGI90_10795 [Candidatus Eisenbacteria bacterium]|nr:hypothetical protein [Candidatus Eisenbacteria bacterium]
MSRNSFLSVLVLSGLGFFVSTTQAAEAPRSRTQIDSLRKAADRAQRALIDAERMAEADPETIIVATRKPGKSVKVDLGKRGIIDIDTEGSHGDKVLMGDDLTVAVGEVVGGDAVSIGGDITVLGKVTGDVVSVGGDVTLGDSSFVGGDAVSVGGSVDRSESAIVVGKVVEVDGPGLGGLMAPWKKPPSEDNFGSRVTGFIQMIIFLLVLFAFAALVLFLARQRIEYASDYLAREPIPSLLLGLVSPVLLFLASILLCITLIGIPVALALLVLYPVFVFVGWVVAGHRIGRSIQAGETPLRTVFTGLMILSGLMLLNSFLKMAGVGGFLRFIVIFTGLTISSLGAFAGLGAILGTRFRRAPMIPVAPAAAEPISMPAPLPTPWPPID